MTEKHKRVTDRTLRNRIPYQQAKGENSLNAYVRERGDGLIALSWQDKDETWRATEVFMKQQHADRVAAGGDDGVLEAPFDNVVDF